MTDVLAVTAAGLTHVGYTRRRNEDSFYVGNSLAALADGLGGHVAGDVASSTAIESLSSCDQLREPGELVDTLAHAVHDANAALRRRVASTPEIAGMGTTLVAVLWSGEHAALANIGDSRAYLLRQVGGRRANETVQITEDHVYRNLVADSPRIPALPERLSRFLDGRPDGRSADITLLTFRPGDRLLLCSDGLSSYVPHRAIHQVLAASEPAARSAEVLVDLALANGGHDNVTVVIVDAR